MKISEQSLQNSERQFLPGNSKANKVTNLSRGLDKGIFGPAKTQKPHLLGKKTYLKKLLEDIIPQNGGKLKANERKKERRQTDMKSQARGIKIWSVSQAFTNQCQQPRSRPNRQPLQMTAKLRLGRQLLKKN